MLRIAAVALAAASPLLTQSPPVPVTRSVASAPITDVRYEVTFTRQTADSRVARVTMTFNTTGSEAILLSLPAWTPGAYEISNFARWVTRFEVTERSTPIAWDKVDYDTWRIQRTSSGPGTLTVAFDYRADTLDNAMAWSKPDFLLLNGTNVFLYPEGLPLTFAARVSINTESDWKVVTSMPSGGTARSYAAGSYHELVDMPFFVGNLDVDSAEVAGRTMRFATYPAGAVTGAARAKAWDEIKHAVPPEVAVFGETPWDSYSIMQIIDSTYQGASGLEHASSHVDVLSPAYIGSAFQPSLYAHEIFHAWNVKRLRPADMWPYRYDAPMPTPWLWVSEGITDYYADLALVRGGVVSDTGFYALTASKLDEVASTEPVALEDASLNTWVHPVDGTQYIYYPKGSLVGLLLDVMIRDASDNRRSLDDVMRDLYATSYKRGRGFTSSDWWSAVSKAAGGKSFTDFERRYVNGRDPLPAKETLALAGMRVTPVRAPRIGIATTIGPAGVQVTGVEPGSAAAEAHVEPGDYLIAVENIAVADQDFGAKFRAQFASAREGQPFTLKVSRNNQTLTLTAPLRFADVGSVVSADPNANSKAVRIRAGILHGTAER